MQSAPIPQNEDERLKRVMELGLLDTKINKRLDEITLEALKAFNVPISTVTVIDENRELYRSCQGLDVKEVPREVSFCAHAMLSSKVFIIEDTLKDIRFKDNPMVIGKPYIRFYAGIALNDEKGMTIGVFCIKDTKPRSFSAEEITKLLSFGERAESELIKSIEPGR